MPVSGRALGLALHISENQRGRDLQEATHEPTLATQEIINQDVALPRGKLTTAGLEDSVAEIKRGKTKAHLG